MSSQQQSSENQQRSTGFARTRGFLRARSSSLFAPTSGSGWFGGSQNGNGSSRSAAATGYNTPSPLAGRPEAVRRQTSGFGETLFGERPESSASSDLYGEEKATAVAKRQPLLRRTGSNLFRLLRKASQPLKDSFSGGSRIDSMNKHQNAEQERRCRSAGRDSFCCGFKKTEKSKLCSANNSSSFVTGDGESGFFQTEEDEFMVDAPKATQEVTYTDFTTILPAELSSHIFSFLDCDSVIACNLVNSTWRSLSSATYVWRSIFTARRGPWPNANQQLDWKKMYRVWNEVDKRWLGRNPISHQLMGHSDSVYCVQFDKEKIISGSRDRTIRVWDMKTLECTKVIGYPTGNLPPRGSCGYHSQSILCLQYDDEILVTGSSDKTCIIWSLPDFTPIKRLHRHAAGVLDVCFNEKYIITCSKDMTVSVWDRKTFAHIRTLEGHTGPVNAIAMRDHYVVSASGDTHVRLWDVTTGECLRVFSGHRRGLACVQFSEDRKLIVSGGNDHTIRLWDAETGAEIQILEGHSDLVRTLQLDCKNRRIVSGSYDKTVSIWDLDTREKIANLVQYHRSSVLTAKADFRRVVSASQDKAIVVVDFGHDVEGIECLDPIAGGR